MLDAVRQAVIDARTPPSVTLWVQRSPTAAPEIVEEEVIRSKESILEEASKALLAQANQTRESVISLIQASD